MLFPFWCCAVTGSQSGTTEWMDQWKDPNIRTVLYNSIELLNNARQKIPVIQYLFITGPPTHRVVMIAGDCRWLDVVCNAAHMQRNSPGGSTRRISRFPYFPLLRHCFPSNVIPKAPLCCLQSWLDLPLAKGAKSAIYDCLVFAAGLYWPHRSIVGPYRAVPLARWKYKRRTVY